jgi:hypothetical protein
MLKGGRIRGIHESSVADPYQIEKQDPDPYQIEKHDPDPYQKGLNLQKVKMVKYSANRGENIEAKLSARSKY